MNNFCGTKFISQEKFEERESTRQVWTHGSCVLNTDMNYD